MVEIVFVVIIHRVLAFTELRKKVDFVEVDTLIHLVADFKPTPKGVWVGNGLL